MHKTIPCLILALALLTLWPGGAQAKPKPLRHTRADEPCFIQCTPYKTVYRDHDPYCHLLTVTVTPRTPSSTYSFTMSSTDATGTQPNPVTANVILVLPTTPTQGSQRPSQPTPVNQYGKVYFTRQQMNDTQTVLIKVFPNDTGGRREIYLPVLINCPNQSIHQMNKMGHNKQRLRRKVLSGGS